MIAWLRRKLAIWRDRRRIAKWKRERIILSRNRWRS